MASGWSSSSTQRATNASSISSISSKRELASASFVSGHNLSLPASAPESPSARTQGVSLPGSASALPCASRLGPPPRGCGAPCPLPPLSRELRERQREQLGCHRG